MSFDPPRSVNPFEAPLAGIGERALYQDIADNDAELIRREHLGRESNIKSLGHLSYLGAFFGALGTIGLGLMAVGVIPTDPNLQNGVDATSRKFLLGGIAFFYLVLTALNGAIGHGLTHLQPWARWTMVVFTSIGLLYVAAMSVVAFVANPIAGLLVLLVGGGFNGLIMYLLVSSKAGVVFSREYKEVIRKTPHVKQKMSIIVKIFVGLLVFVILLGVAALIFSPRR